MSHGKPYVTMKDIAQKLNVSVTTISKVINGHTDISEKKREEVLSCIKEMGYVPNIMATNLRRNQTKVVALVLSDISKPYFGKVLDGCESVLNAAGYQTMTFSSMEQNERENRFVRQAVSMNMAGMIIDPAQDSKLEKDTLHKAGIPYVFSNRFLDAERDYYVVADNEKAGFIGTSHLIERKPGRPVACVNGPSRISPTVTRFEGYKNALNNAGVPYNPDYVFGECYGLNDAYEIGKKIVAVLPKPFSVFCNTDQFAIGVLRAVRDAGLRVPQDAAVIGVDDIDEAMYLTPALSTVALPKKRIGEKSAEMLLKLINNDTVEQPRIKLQPELIIRETT